MVEEEALSLDGPLLAQVSRWDRLKDPLGVLAAFAEHVHAERGAAPVLAGPDVSAVADDPEGAEVFAEVEAAWHDLPPDVRRRVHLALLPMEDADENAVIVNALQRRADVVAQKSLAEGFGLTVAEAMWKGRPVVATRVGGIRDQIEDGRSGCLVDPLDLPAFGEQVSALLRTPTRPNAWARRHAGACATCSSARATSANTPTCSRVSAARRGAARGRHRRARAPVPSYSPPRGARRCGELRSRGAGHTDGTPPLADEHVR